MTQMNIGEAGAVMVLAKQVGDIMPLAAGAPFSKAFKVRSLGSLVSINSALGSDVAAQGRGTPGAPYKTFAAAVAAVGEATTKAEYENTISFDIYGGTHDVDDVELPMGNYIINLLGNAVLTGTLTWNMNSGKIFASTKAPTLAINNVGGAVGVTGFEELAIVEEVAATPTVTAAVYLREIECSNVTAPATLTALTIEMHRCAIGDADPVLVPTALVTAYDSVFATPLRVRGGVFDGCLMSDAITTTVQCVFLGCEFGGTHVFTGPAATLAVDGHSNYWFKTRTWTLAGGATKIIQSDNTA